MLSISFFHFPAIPIPFQNLSRESVFRTLSKHQKATQVGLAAIGLLSLYFGIQKASIITTKMGVLSLVVSYKLPKIINEFFTSPKILIQRLHTWHESLPDRDLGKDEALSRIEAFIKNPRQTKLDLSDLSISSLPDIFDSLIFNKPKSLDLSNTRISTLPVGFNSPNLEDLYLERTQITSLPKNFTPPNLKILHLNRTEITRLPVGFNPPSLTHLGLSNTAITSLPESFSPPNLEVLYLWGTQITSLPVGFNPYKLKSIDLSDTAITSLPAGFNPPNLQVLSLSSTPITSLPDHFSPPNLQALDLERTQITSLPESILDLPNTCTVYLTISNFSNAVQGQIQRATDQEGYTGPDFEYDIQGASVSTSASLKEALTKVLKASEVDNQSPSQFKILTTQTEKTKQDDMKTWLDRLCHTASAKSAGRKVFFRSIVDTLHLAENDPEFKSLFHSVVKGATETCGDRVALSALHLDIQSQLNRIETTKSKEVYKFLVHTIYTMDFLEKRASEIIPTLRLTDPLEVYLGLPVKLREEFNISINTKDMLYFSCGGLTEAHLTQARSDLHQALKDQEKIVAFLIGQPKWIEALSHTSGEALAQAKSQRDADGVDPSRAVEALQTYEESLKNLSLETLKERSIF